MRTIAAISTPPGKGGIGIVRMSGESSLEILKKIFTKNEIRPRFMHYGKIVYENRVIDEVMACYFNKPRTYTCEDMVEIYCHGGYVSCLYILEILLKLGAVPAEAGEFTKLAFLNGRIDLLEAEAVEGIIEAESKEEQLMYADVLGGKLTEKLESVLNDVVNLISECEAKIDYPELGDVDGMKEKLEKIHGGLVSFLDDEKRTTYIRDGLKLAIIGRPNVGKSSLLNALTNKERAIVTEIAGTTRDTIEETINYEGLTIRLIDTAGIRSTDEVIEKEGIKLSKKAAEEADFVVVVLDGSVPLQADDFEIMELVKDKEKIFLINKEDKGLEIDLKSVEKYGEYIISSIKNDSGVRELLDAIKKRIVHEIDFNVTSIFNIRHVDLIERAISEIETAIRDIDVMPFEIVEVSLREAHEYISMILGRDTSEDIIDRVFRDFCVGK